jgi:hypothetical protein
LCVNPLFIKINSKLLQKYNINSMHNLSDHQKLECLCSYWKKEFNIDVIIEDSIPKKLVFRNKNDLLTFLIKSDNLD